MLLIKDIKVVRWSINHARGDKIVLELCGIDYYIFSTEIERLFFVTSQKHELLGWD